jgi:hypothetical protein
MNEATKFIEKLYEKREFKHEKKVERWKSSMWIWGMNARKRSNNLRP